MIVAVAPVGVVQVIAHEIVLVIAVGDGFMAAAGAVVVAAGVPRTRVCGRARFGVGRARREAAFVDMVPVDRVQMAVVKIVRVTFVLDRGVPATRPMGMLVRLVRLVFHGSLLSAPLRRAPSLAERNDEANPADVNRGARDRPRVVGPTSRSLSYGDDAGASALR
jgi:hypothetical protein